MVRLVAFHDGLVTGILEVPVMWRKSGGLTAAVERFLQEHHTVLIEQKD